MYASTAQLTVAVASLLLGTKTVAAAPENVVARANSDHPGTPVYFPYVQCDNENDQSKVLDKLAQDKPRFMACSNCHFQVGGLTLSSGKDSTIPPLDTGTFKSVYNGNSEVHSALMADDKDFYEFDIPGGAKMLTFHWTVTHGDDKDYTQDAEVISCS